MLEDHWPLGRLRLGTPRLELRQPDDEELAALAEVAAAGVHHPGERPYLTPWTDLPPRQRALHVLQRHWSRRGSWSVDAWTLELGVFHEQRPLGMVALRARDFPVLREVRTESWLGLDHHRRGLGTEARTALLHLAFEELGAVSAVSEAFQDNAGSQGVSRKLGYRHDGTTRDVLDGRAVVSDRLRLDRADWQRTPHAPVTVTGLTACLPFFGC
ncbi:GNAT family N-acetyltransferase [Kineococcus xinjiangensis]|uniref:GNAT family N-acetyltransferase n=1 Tax=Kineococcus xinjiangensis TaxID=512762 RepID=UPI000CEC79EE|nr:GNAT family N-acetyltransferase [Kineococcus xinjiangensis]